MVKYVQLSEVVDVIRFQTRHNMFDPLPLDIRDEYAELIQSVYNQCFVDDTSSLASRIAFKQVRIFNFTLFRSYFGSVSAKRNYVQFQHSWCWRLSGTKCNAENFITYFCYTVRIHINKLSVLQQQYHSFCLLTIGCYWPLLICSQLLLYLFSMLL